MTDLVTDLVTDVVTNLMTDLVANLSGNRSGNQSGDRFSNRSGNRLHIWNHTPSRNLRLQLNPGAGSTSRDTVSTHTLSESCSSCSLKVCASPILVNKSNYNYLNNLQSSFHLFFADFGPPSHLSVVSGFVCIFLVSRPAGLETRTFW